MRVLNITTGRRVLILVLALVAALLVLLRIYLNPWVLNYVNKTLNEIPGYKGSVQAIDLDLYRGAYRIHDLRLYKKEGKIPTPFLFIAQTDFSIQWSALFQGRIVSDVELYKPTINFATRAGAVQDGTDVDWNKPIRDLMPIDINLVTVRDGKVTFLDFSSSPKVDLDIHNIDAELHNLRNVEDKSGRLPSSLQVSGTSIGKGKLNVKGRLNVMKRVPDMDLDAKLEQVDLTALNDFARAYAAIDFKKGDFSLYSEVKVKNNKVSGYAKPIIRDYEIISLKKTNPVKLAWEAIVSSVMTLFTNLPRDQFATTIPLEGTLDEMQTDNWTAFVGIIRNAFLGALEKGFEQDED